MVARWPETKITGIDMSAEMLEKARKKHPNNSNIQFLQSTYASGLLDEKKQPDVILFSYALTMFNPGWEEAIQSAVEDLAPSGYIAVVDFHDSSSGSFKNWMQKNHVKMEGHLLPVLESNFETAHLETKPAYGIWNYLLYVGQKK
jgi:S-adenosylmethionine-diacylgycerolhomoserine-N-methlytransferase